MARTTRKTQANTENTRTRSRAEILEERRKVRTDVGTMRNILTYPTGEKAEGKHFRYVNDVKDRIDQFKKMGWMVWDEDNVLVGDPNQAVEMNVAGESGVRVPMGGGVTAVLMWIPQEYWEADQHLKELDIRATEKAMNKRLKAEGLDAYDTEIDTRATSPKYREESSED